MKAQEVRQLIAENDYKSALRGAKDFRIGVTAEQRSIMTRGYECYVRPAFFKRIGKDPDECIKAGISVLREVVG